MTLEDRSVARARIVDVIRRLVRPAIYGERAPLAVSAHHLHGEPIPVAEACTREYTPFGIGQSWGGAWDTTWFRMEATIPPGWSGNEVVALVDLGGAGTVGFTAEGLVWEGDDPRQGLHLKHREYVVAGSAAGGEQVELLIEAAANPIPPWETSPWPLLMPDYDGAPIYALGQAELAVVHRDVETLYFDMRVLSQLLNELPESDPRASELFVALEAACDALASGDVVDAVPAARAELAPALATRAGPDAHRVSAIGHAHIDTAWLWPIRETKRKCARTFANALRLMEDYPEYRFSASQAQQYAWIKEHYPPLYERMREQIAAGRFEPVGSMWVEADCNIPSGESLVRQIVHGKRFFEAEFGRETTDLWLPDVFGYSAALPQILKEAGISSFLTQKMSWSEVNRFPHSTFWWEGIDGTRILTHFPPADTYNGDMSLRELVKADRQFAQRAESNRSVYPFGWGDGGGGPTRAMLESARRLVDLEGAPRVEIDTVAAFWEKARAETDALPVWVGELYLEYHRGTYTTNGAVKRGNRRNEQALRAAELWSVAAATAYPVDALDEAWKLLLLNQFHDIIPGSSIHWANLDCLRDHERIAELTGEIIASAQRTIAAQVDTTAMTRPYVVFNAASRDRHDLVEVNVDGQAVLVPVDVPACGYAVVDIDAALPATGTLTVSDRSLENELLRVEWDDDGLLTSVFDKEQHREVLTTGARGNVFQLHDDNPKEFDAWNVDIDYLDHRVDITAITEIAIVENGPQRGAVRFVREFGDSKITQTMRLAIGSRRLEFDTEVDWHEDHKFLKVAFPVDVLASRATYEIQFGHLERPTHTNTSWDIARFEVRADRWADLSEPGYGVALLNDCKYGYDIHGNVMRLSLLRAPGWPDPESDRGVNRFSYALFPHAGDLRTAGVIAEAEAFNVPLTATPVVTAPEAPSRPLRASIVAVDHPNVTIEAVKQADRGDAIVVRLCEVWGTRGPVTVMLDRPITRAVRTDVLERKIAPLPIKDGRVELDLRPFELVTLELELRVEAADRVERDARDRRRRQAVDLWRERLGACSQHVTPGAEGATAPRKLSGTRTVGVRHLWRAARRAFGRGGLTDGESRRAEQSATGRISQVPRQRGSAAVRRGRTDLRREDEPMGVSLLPGDEIAQERGQRRVTFADRHIGPSAPEQAAMLAELGYESLDALVDAAVPAAIREHEPLELGGGASEQEAVARLRALGDHNEVFTSLIGLGYYDTFTPLVILRNVLENPAWYTAYTPYQPEISQGRLEALVNFQTMVTDLTAMEIANASMLDEATAAAEAMALLHRVNGDKGDVFVVDPDCFPQTIAVVRTRAEPLGIELVEADLDDEQLPPGCFGVLVQYPGASGQVRDYRELIQRAHLSGALVAVAADLLALTLLTPPGEMGADVAVGSSQRFGVPLGFGGPHAGYFATRDEFKRTLPGRLAGVSIDAEGRAAYRLTLQTREQHIRREKATSNICTAQVLLAVIAGLYASYHGAAGLRAIAERVHRLACVLVTSLGVAGIEVVHDAFFDTITVRVPGRADEIAEAARARRINLRVVDFDTIGISLDETTTLEILGEVCAALGADLLVPDAIVRLQAVDAIPPALRRTSEYLTHPVFSAHRSEHQMLRYLRALADRDLALDRTMIPLGSCTMKLNATAEMEPITWPEWGRIHPFAPLEQVGGYLELINDLEGWLAEITGYDAVSLQPNAGSQGEYAGLLAIRLYHESRGESGRDVCLIPASAHGTNAASAAMAGLRVVVVACDENGNVDLADLEAKTAKHADQLAALMVTYPSTHGVYEEHIGDICASVHDHGGQVYLDGANLNALVGVARPGRFGADVSHINLHKTFCIPHGGGGPGVGPIGVRVHLAPFLPNHPLQPDAGPESGVAISAAPWGSAGILPISWAYITMMGAEGLRHATQVAILNANYLARRLGSHFPVLYTGANGLVAHECIIDLRPITQQTGVSVDDVAKRLIDYGFHAPTMSFPVAGTLMIEPTESEDRAEIDRFIDAMIAIRAEIDRVGSGEWPADDNPLVHAPHTAVDVTSDAWARVYPRELAAFPVPALRLRKYWPPVGRIDNVYGDRNVFCSCPPIEAYE